MAANKSKVSTMCHLYNIQICSKQMPSLYEWSFQTGSNMRIKARNSFLKLNILFEKPVPDKKVCLILDLKHYYLNDLSDSNLLNVGRFDYALAIIKNIFLFIKQIFIHPFLFSFSCFTLKDHNENKAIRLFCVILVNCFSSL